MLLLAFVTFWVGLVVGVERVAVPLLGASAFHLSSFLLILSFVAVFGFVKATVNLVGGGWADRVGRRPLLLLGWVVILPAPVLILAAPNWWWVVAANVLVGVNQGLTWSTSVTAIIDSVGRARRGFGVGVAEFAGYGGVTIGGFGGGVLAAEAVRTAPFVFMLVIAAFGLVVTLAVRETLVHVGAERGRAAEGSVPSGRPTDPTDPTPPPKVRFRFGGGRRLIACSQAGLAEKFVDTVAWGILPIYLVSEGLPVVRTGVVVAIYTGVWTVLQLATGPLSDRVGRRLPIAAGLIIAGVAVALLVVSEGFWEWSAAAALAGTGMALIDPTLIARAADLAAPAERGAYLGTFRFWRDAGYGFAGVSLGLLADVQGLSFALYAVALFMVGSAAAFLLLDRGPPAGDPAPRVPDAAYRARTP